LFGTKKGEENWPGIFEAYYDPPEGLATTRQGPGYSTLTA